MTDTVVLPGVVAPAVDVAAAPAGPVKQVIEGAVAGAEAAIETEYVSVGAKVKAFVIKYGIPAGSFVGGFLVGKFT